MERFVYRLLLSLLATFAGPWLAEAAELPASAGASAPSYMLSVNGPAQARPARLLVREGQMASYATSGRAVGITVRRAAAGLATVEVVELHELEPIKQGGSGPRYEPKAIIDIRTVAHGEAWQVPVAGLELAVTAEPTFRHRPSTETCPDGAVPKNDPGTCCI